MTHNAENDAPVYGCCQHCADYDAGQEFCEQAPHDEQCIQPYCAGGRPVFGVIPPAHEDGGA